MPEGYTQDTDKHIYNLEYQDCYTDVITTAETVQNTVQKGKFEVIKISSNTNTTAEIIEGAEFTAILSKYVEFYGSFDEALLHLDEYADDEYAILTTDEDGYAISNELAYGEYTVYETYTPSDEIDTVEPFYVTIDSDGALKKFVENDTPFESYLKMIKVDADSGKTVVLNNATFNLYKLNEDTEEWEQVSCKTGKETYDSWTTDESGYAYTETKLEAGTYKIDEIVIPDGYLELEEECIFYVNRSNKTLEYDEDNDAWITVTVENAKPTGTLTINKSVDLRENVDTSLIDDIDYTQISFELIANEDIIDMADGSIIYENGETIGIYYLDEAGTLTIENIPMGAYTLQEKTTMINLVLDNTVYDVVFEQEDTTTKVYTVTEEIENDTTLIEISKQNIGGEEIEGATLQVIDESGNIIDEWISTDTPHTIEGLEVGKTYTLHEEICVEGYVKATDQEFTISNTGEVQSVIMIDKVVEITKTDLTTGEEIEGAELQVTDEDGNIIDEWTSTTEPHIISGLEEGKTYTLTEITAPYGYEVAESITFTVSYDKETQVIEMCDTPILTDIKLIKIDSDTKEVITDDFTFGLYADEDCTELIQQRDSDSESGTVTFSELRYGIYYIKEINAPDGYNLSDEIIKVEINDEGVFINDEKIDQDEDGIYSFEFENTKLETPNTGDESNLKLWVVLFIISISGIIGIGIYNIKKKKLNK